MNRYFLRWFARVFIKPILLRKLRKTSFWTTDGMDLMVRQGVFHPRYFYSTRYLLDYLKEIHLKELKILDVGCGSGCLSVYSAMRGAEVTALDINPAALTNTIENAERNRVQIRVLLSDLFDALSGDAFDLIVVNPPYYPRNPLKPEDHAWYCGEDFAYFSRFFCSCHHYLAGNGRILMVLSESCRLDLIAGIAEKCGKHIQLIRQGTSWGEKIYLYSVVAGKNESTENKG